MIITAKVILGFYWVVIVGYWYWFYKSFKRYKINKVVDSKDGVSVIIAYKNATSHIEKTIRYILSQEYSNFEIIAIDDFSNDGGMENLLQIQDKRLILKQAKKNIEGKKAALSEAIKYAKNDLLLFTDADCRPASKYWIQSMSNIMISKSTNDIVLGYGPTAVKNGWLNIFERYETILTATQYFTYAYNHMPYMGVGRNLMYRKSLFNSVSGYSNHENIPSGDDDLFIKNAANEVNTSINLDPNSFVYSDGKPSIIQFFNQKTRHTSTSWHYKILHKLLLGMFAIVHIMFYVTIIYLAFFKVTFVLFSLIMLLSKWMIQMVFYKRIFKILDGKNLFYYFPLLDASMCLYYTILPIFSLKRPKGW